MLAVALIYLSALVLGKNYAGYQILEAKAKSEADFNFLNSLQDEAIIDLWSEGKGPLLFSVSSRNVQSVKKLLSDHSIAYGTVGDLGEMIQLENSQQSLNDPKYFSKYRKIDEINDYLASLEKDYPTMASRFSIGKSYKGNEIFGIKFTGNNTNKMSAPQKILFHGGIHAREWIGPAVVAFIATELLKQYGGTQTITSLLDRFEFHIIPVLNVDGYAFSHDRDRMWRKNRQPNTVFMINIGGWLVHRDRFEQKLC